jgi:hypothetical protein
MTHEKNTCKNNCNEYTYVIRLQAIEEEVLAFILLLLVNFVAGSESTRIITKVRI